MRHCPPEAELVDWLAGAARDSADLAHHIEQCSDCQTCLDRMTQDSTLKPPASREPEPALQLLLRRLRLALVEEVPHQIRNIRIERELGRGGMGIVYLGHDDLLRRPVAVKVLRSELATPEGRSRFLREARAAAAVSHENVTRVFAVADPPGASPYLVLEYVPGSTLRDQIRQHGSLPPRQAATWLAQAADGIAAAHAAGLIHRDIKPANLLLDRVHGGLKVTDFGLADVATDTTVWTTRGDLLGTPAYMSPEQVVSADLAVARSDVYSLGATLYEALTGVEPFRGSVAAVLEQVRTREPLPPRTLNETVPVDLETICLKAMTKEPEGRYASAHELAADLRRWLAGEPILARPLGRLRRVGRWSRRNPKVAGLSLAVVSTVLLGFAGVTWQWRRADVQRDRAEANYLRACEALRFWMANGERDLRTARGLSLAHRVWLDQSLQKFREDPQHDMTDPSTALAIAITQLQIGLHATETGAIAEAEAAFDESRRLLLQVEPTNPMARVYLAQVELYLGELHLYVSLQTDRARRHYQQAQDSFERVRMASFPEAQRRRNIALCVYLEGSVHIRRGELKVARERLDHARRQFQELNLAQPTHPDYRQRLASIDQFDGEYYLRMNQPVQAVECLERCRVVREETLGDLVWDIRFQRDMARVDRLLGQAEMARGHCEVARQVWIRARARITPLAEQNPHLPQFGVVLVGILTDLAQLEPVEPALQSEIQTRSQSLRRRFPQLPVVQQGLDGIHERR